MSMLSTARASWRGSLLEGSGRIETTGSGAIGDLPITWSSRTETAGGRTSPEELIAAAHAACFSMALSHRLANAGHPAERLEVSATVSFDKGEAGWGISSIELAAEGRVPGIEAAEFEALAADAKENCPVSRALKGNVAIVVHAQLESVQSPA